MLLFFCGVVSLGDPLSHLTNSQPSLSKSHHWLMALSRVPRNGRVGVLGAGISGLSYAYFLHKLRPDINITIFEKSNQPGGWIKSTKLENDQQSILLEKGPRTLRGVSDGTLLIVDILKKLGIDSELKVMKSSALANRKFIVGSEQQLVEVPRSVWTFVQFLKSGALKGIPSGAIKEIFQKNVSPKDESIEDFIRRRFKSTALTDRIMSAVLHGIYAGDVAKLSVNSVLPGLAKLEQEHGSIMRGALKNLYRGLSKKKETRELAPHLVEYQDRISPGADLVALSNSLKGYPIVLLENGLQELPLAMARYLQEQENVELHYSSNIASIDLGQRSITCNNKTESFAHIHSSINVHSLGTLVENKALKDAFSRIVYVSIFMANIYSKGPLIPKGQEGFGFLVPKGVQNQERLLGIIFDSDIETHSQRLNGRAQEQGDYSKITIMMGGHFFGDGIPSNSVNLRAVKKSLHQYLGIDVDKRKVLLRDEAKETNHKVVLDGDDILISYSVHKDCIPQYNVGYEETKKRTQKLLQDYHGTISLGGMCFGRGIGVPDCVSNALDEALETAK